MSLMVTIYMPLLDEGVGVWRPVQARRIAGDVYLISGEVPEGEQWAFAPGSKVRCIDRRLSGDGGKDGVHKVIVEDVG
jgi:hypothetical protein